MNSRIVTKNHAADPEKRFLTKFQSHIVWPIWPCRQRGSTLISLRVFTCSWKLGKCLWTQSRTFSRNRSILGNPGVRHPFIRILSILFSSLAQSARAYFITHQMTQNYYSSKWRIFLSQYPSKGKINLKWMCNENGEGSNIGSKVSFFILSHKKSALTDTACHHTGMRNKSWLPDSGDHCRASTSNEIVLKRISRTRENWNCRVNL